MESLVNFNDQLFINAAQLFELVRYFCTKVRVSLVYLIAIIFSSCAFGQLRTHRVSFDAGPNLSYSDANTKVGYGAKVSYIRKLNLLNWKHTLGVGLSAGVDRVSGGKNALFNDGSNEYVFNAMLYKFEPRIDGSLYFGKFKKIEITPFVSAGLVYIQSRGVNEDKVIAEIFYNSWGDDYFTPVYSEENELVAISTKEDFVSGIFTAGAYAGYYVKHNLKLHAGPSISYAFTDNLDGLNLPLAVNKSKDVFVSITVGISYVYRNQRKFKVW